MTRASSSLIALALVSTLISCKLPPPTMVHLVAINSNDRQQHESLPPDMEHYEAAALAKDHLKPTCDIRSGKPVNDDARLAVVMSHVHDWQKHEKKAPKKPEPPPSAPSGPIQASISLSIPALAAGKRATDLDPDWFTMSCENGRILITLDEDSMDLDVLYSFDDRRSPELWLGGYSMKSKHVFMAKVNVTARPPHTVPDAKFYVYDVSTYLPPTIDEVVVQRNEAGFMMSFLEPGHTSGFRVAAHQYSDRADAGRFTVVAKK